MISFRCPHCDKAVKAPDKAAGRSGRCNACKQSLTIPYQSTRLVVQVPTLANAPKPVATPPAKLSPRMRRLFADAAQLQTALKSSPLIQLESAIGEPAELYRIAYRVRGLERGQGDKPAFRDHHLVEIQLTSEYPRQSPKCKMLTPIFHPNIDPVAICVGDHWTAAERLIDLVIRIGEIIAYQAYNLQSPLDGEAAMWADLHRAHLPVDPRDLRPPELQ